jgi:drug/metabolite transporter (DMT)-like permease
MITQRPTGSSLLFAAAPAVFVVLWSTGFIGAKLGLPYAEPATFLALRFALVGLILGAMTWVTGTEGPGTWKNAMHIMTVGVLVHGVYLGGIYLGISLGVSAGDSALIVGLQPMLTAMLAGPMLSEPIRARQWVGFLLGTVGVALVSSRYLGLFDSSVIGVILCVVAVIGMSVGTLYQKRFCSEMNLLSGSFLQFLAAALMMGIVSFVFDTQNVQWSGEFVLALAWLVVVLSLGAMTLLWMLVRHQAATRVASLFFLVPPVTALIAWPLFGETFSYKSALGMILVVGGVLLVSYGNNAARLRREF